jgi:hypothetical protein
VSFRLLRTAISPFLPALRARARFIYYARLLGSVFFLGRDHLAVLATVGTNRLLFASASSRIRLCLPVFATTWLACAASASQPSALESPAPTAASVPPAPVASTSSPWRGRWASSERHGFRVRLPDATWRFDDASEPDWVARSASAEVRIRVWTERALAHQKGCRERAEVETILPDAEALRPFSQLVDRRLQIGMFVGSLRLLAHETQIESARDGVLTKHASVRGPSAVGYVLAIAALDKRCVAFAWTQKTSTSVGELGSTLAEVETQVLTSLTIRDAQLDGPPRSRPSSGPQ